jgi:hypothetical protein
MRLGWTYPTYAAHESGWRIYPAKVARKYAKAFGVSEEWLLFGKSPPSWYTPFEPQMFEVESPVRYMALFSDEEANAIEQVLDSDITRRDFCISDMGNLPPGCFAVKVVSDEAVGDGFKVGDILIFHMTDEEPPPGSIVILNVKRQLRPSIRRVRAAPGGRLRYVAASENYDDIDTGDGRVFGRAVMHIHRI